jgi:hypothetical protein
MFNPTTPYKHLLLKKLEKPMHAAERPHDFVKYIRNKHDQM